MTNHAERHTDTSTIAEGDATLDEVIRTLGRDAVDELYVAGALAPAAAAEYEQRYGVDAPALP
jgi:hypothetical protein